MTIEQEDYDATLEPRLDSSLATMRFQGVYKRRPGDEPKEFSLILLDGGDHSELILFIRDNGYALIDRDLLADNVGI
jgi:hypothetical protein